MNAYRPALIIIILIATLLFDSFVVTDYLLAGPYFRLFVAGRFLVLTPAGLACALIVRKSRRFYHAAQWLFPVCMAGTLTVMLARSAGDYRIHYMFGDLFIMVGMTVLTRSSVLITASAVLTDFVLYQYLVFFTDIVRPDDRALFEMFSLCAVVISICASYLLETAERRAFDLKRSLRLANRELELLAELDPLTGLHNRRALERALRAIWAGRDNTPTSMIILDLDDFKLFNDSYGHPAGDDCLKRVSRRVVTNIRGGQDLAVRIGGEEIAILLRRTDLRQAAMLAERIRIAIITAAIPHPALGHGAVVTASFGVATALVAESTPEALIQDTDRALYEAKRAGRNRVATSADAPPGSLDGD